MGGAFQSVDLRNTKVIAAATGPVGGAAIAQNQGIEVRWRAAGFFVYRRWSLV